MSDELHTPEFLAARHAAMLAQTGFAGVDETDPTEPSGHAYGIRVSSRLTSDYRKRVRKLEVHVTPDEVIDCLRAAGVKNWVLMGLHGYVGYLPMPRATQDVDVMVPYSEKNRAVTAIADRWPMLLQRASSQVVRFLDPADDFPDGQPKPVVDIMLPWSPFQQSILKHHVTVDAKTGNRHPTLEAAIVSKYAPLVSPHRSMEKKSYDAGDLRRIIRANHDQIDRSVIRELGNQVWEQGGEERLRFLDLAMQDNRPRSERTDMPHLSTRCGASSPKEYRSKRSHEFAPGSAFPTPLSWPTAETDRIPTARAITHAEPIRVA